MLYLAGMRIGQGMKDQGSKCESTTIKSLRDSAASSKNARRFSTIASENTKQAEESLRIVMFLSCWGPN